MIKCPHCGRVLRFVYVEVELKKRRRCVAYSQSSPNEYVLSDCDYEEKEVMNYEVRCPFCHVPLDIEVIGFDSLLGESNGSD